MKTIVNYLMLTCASFFISVNVFAQSESEDSKRSEDSREKIQFGLKAGANYSTMFDDNNTNFNPSAKLGLAAGGFLSIPFGKYIGVQPELVFSQKGYKAYGNNYEYTRTTNHLDVPLLIQLKPSKVVYIVGGPMYSYTLSKNDRFTSGGLSVEQQQEFTNNNISKNTVAVMGGLDFNFKHVVVSGRASWDLFDNNGNGTSTNPRYKNFFTQATIGFKF